MYEKNNKMPEVYMIISWKNTFTPIFGGTYPLPLPSPVSTPMEIYDGVFLRKFQQVYSHAALQINLTNWLSYMQADVGTDWEDEHLQLSRRSTGKQYRL